MAERKIRILKNGPYIVSGSVPINEKIITPQGKSEVVFTEGRVLPQASTY